MLEEDQKLIFNKPKSVMFMPSTLLCYLGWQSRVGAKNMNMVIFLRLKSLTVGCNMVLSQIFTILATISQQPVPTTDKSTAGVCTVCAGFISTAGKEHKQ